MKTKILFAVTLLSIQLAASSLTPAPTITAGINKSALPAFAFVRGHKQGKNTAVTWGMTNNAGIINFIVECTYEDPTDIYSVWQTVGDVACTRMPIFKFVDNPVLPGTLSYRITAVMNDNTTIISEVYSVTITGS